MASEPTAALLIIGNEILSGRTQDANLPVLAKDLGKIGIPVLEARVVRDEQDAIVDALDELRATHTHVFTSGGLGPTHDDITSASIAAAFGVPVVRHPEAIEVMAAHYERHGLPFNEARRSMADVPEGASLVANPISAAPGFHIGNVFAFAGVPAIFRAMLDGVLPTLSPGTPVLSRSLGTGLAESLVAEPLGALQARHADVEIGSYPRFDARRWATTLVFRAADPARLDAAFEEAKEMVIEQGGTPEEA